jgi:hypothetical protein
VTVFGRIPDRITLVVVAAIHLMALGYVSLASASESCQFSMAIGHGDGKSPAGSPDCPCCDGNTAAVAGCTSLCAPPALPGALPRTAPGDTKAVANSHELVVPASRDYQPPHPPPIV